MEPNMVIIELDIEIGSVDLKNKLRRTGPRSVIVEDELQLISRKEDIFELTVKAFDNLALYLLEFPFLQVLTIKWNNNQVSLDLSNITLSRCKVFKCSSTRIKLPSLPVCEELDCNSCEIINLPDLPSCIVANVSYNKLTKLPPMPRIKRLNCSYNKIQNLTLSNTIEWLDCSYNKISHIDDMPKCSYLRCERNKLTKLPKLKFLARKKYNHNNFTSQRVSRFILVKCIAEPICDYIINPWVVRSYRR